MGIFDKLFGKNQIKVWQKWMEGPSLFEAFLIKIGFDITADEIKKMRAPITLRRDQYKKAEKI